MAWVSGIAKVRVKIDPDDSNERRIRQSEHTCVTTPDDGSGVGEVTIIPDER